MMDKKEQQRTQTQQGYQKSDKAVHKDGVQDAYPIGNNLNEKQYRAVPLILEGKTDTEVAEAVGVSRATVNTWRNKDPEFIAELNKERVAIQETIMKKQTDTVIKAYEVLNKALDSELNKEDPDPKIALEIIKNYKEPDTKLQIDSEKIKSEMVLMDSFYSY